MNKQRSRTRVGISWTDYTWNPVTGCLRHCNMERDGFDCYAARLYMRMGWNFNPRLHPRRLDEPTRLKKPSKIFVCSTAELFGPWIPQSWIDMVIDATRLAPQHTYQYLTKYPGGTWAIPFPDNSWVGVTITRRRDLWRLEYLEHTRCHTRFASLEPLLEPIEPDEIHRFFQKIDWVIIGGRTGREPWALPEEELEPIEKTLRDMEIPIWEKENLRLERPLIQEWPRKEVTESGQKT